MDRILIIDDSESLCQQLQISLEIAGYDVAYRCTAEDGLRAAIDEDWGVILLDVVLDSGHSGLDLLKEVKTVHPEQQVVMFSGQANIDIAVKATRIGAYDFIEKPAEDERIILTLRNAIEKNQMSMITGQLLSELQEKMSIIGKSKKTLNMLNQVAVLAGSDSKVLILGETGVGKDLIAKAIHFRSKRADKPFVAINCAAIPDSLLESELFGHKKGAFTGAQSTKAGRFELANDGTIFLDEIGDLDYNSQAKVLRWLQSGEFERLGDNNTIKSNARILAATNKDLAEEVKKGTFREDLYYRLNVITLNIPPLRERKEDIPLLLFHFLEKFSAEEGKKISHFSPEALEKLVDYDWQGNVRQLRSIVKRIVVFETKPFVDYASVELALQMEDSDMSGMESQPLDAALQDFERGYIQIALSRSNQNLEMAAMRLGMNTKELQNRISLLGLE